MIVKSLLGAALALTSGATVATVTNSEPDQAPAGLYSSDTRLTSSIAVDGTSTTYVPTVRVTLPVDPGDLLDITAEARVTSPLSYAVGVGARLQYYDADKSSARPWTTFGTLTGDNVFQPRHHMPITMTRAVKVPSSWTPGHRISVNLMIDAASTAWRRGHKITVDSYGQSMVVRKWSAS